MDAPGGSQTVRQISRASDVNEPISPPISPAFAHQRVPSWGQEQSSMQLTFAGALQSGVAQGSCWPEFRGSLAGAAQGAFAAQSGASLPHGSMATGLTAPPRVESFHTVPQLRTGFGLQAAPAQPLGMPSAAWVAQQGAQQGVPLPDAAGADDGTEESEASVRRAARALRLFFSGAQVRAIAAAPPTQYANIPVAGADPSKPPSALAQSLRLALKLLSQDSPQGSRFRARLLLALASPNEKDPASGSADPTKALSSSIDAQIFGMHGPPEEELAPFFALTSPTSNKSPTSPMSPMRSSP